MTGQRIDCAVNDYDVVVIGGGAAGLSGALTLARARRSVLVIDHGEPRNAPAASLHGYLSRDGMAPGELLAAGRAEVTGYGGEVVHDTATSVARQAGRFRIVLQAGNPVTARRLLVTTGLVDEVPDVDGLAQRWACPHRRRPQRRPARRHQARRPRPIPGTTHRPVQRPARPRR